MFKVAHVSTFAPLRCGIATYTTDLINALSRFDNKRYSLNYGSANDDSADGRANVESVESVSRLGESLSMSDCKIVSLQHEFGIWGGKNGENLLFFLDSCKKPIVSIMHTTFGPNWREDEQKRILRELAARSERIVVLTELAKETVSGLIGEQTKKVVVIPHGVPDFAYRDPPQERSASESRNVFSLNLMTVGFFRNDKGFEIALEAVRILLNRGYEVSYRIAGEPQEQFEKQEVYYEEISNIVSDLDLSRFVEIERRYLSVEEQREVIQKSHLGLFPYQCKEQASSGTLPIVLAAGRPAVCTPFEFALARTEFGVVVSNEFTSESIADAIEEGFLRGANLQQRSRKIYNKTRSWVWSEIARRFADCYEEVAKLEKLD